jgi:hypothetical protein
MNEIKKFDAPIEHDEVVTTIVCERCGSKEECTMRMVDDETVTICDICLDDLTA